MYNTCASAHQSTLERCRTTSCCLFKVRRVLSCEWYYQKGAFTLLNTTWSAKGRVYFLWNKLWWKESYYFTYPLSGHGFCAPVPIRRLYLQGRQCTSNKDYHQEDQTDVLSHVAQNSRLLWSQKLQTKSMGYCDTKEHLTVNRTICLE